MINTIISNAADISANYTSESVDISFANGFAVQMQWTGTPTGTLRIQGSLDGILFSNVPSGSVALAGVAGDTLFNTSYPVHYTHVRVSYTAAAGAGTLTVRVGGKEDI
jgi:hypothetical protein